MSIYTFVVQKKEQGLRLMRFLQDNINAVRNDIRFSIEHQGCLVNDQLERFASRRLQANDKVTLRLMTTIPLSKKQIIYEDTDLIAFDKPSHVPSEKVAEFLKLDLIHRLDMGTSGVLLFAKHDECKKKLEHAFRNREIHKEYLAWIGGSYFFKEKLVIKPILLKKEVQGKVKAIINPKGKMAKTKFLKVNNTSHYTLVRAIPITGRTHQIRCHLQHLGFPILGDVEYGDLKSSFTRLHLHAEKLCFKHPYLGEEMTISSRLPKDFFPKSISHQRKKVCS